MFGRSILQKGEINCLLPAGRWAVLDALEGYVVHPRARYTRLVVLQIPLKCLSADMSAVCDSLQKGPFAHYNRALLRTMRIFAATPHRFDTVMTENLSKLLCRVVEHAIRSENAANRRARSAYSRRLSRVYGYVKRNINRVELPLSDIATDAGCTVRYLQKMFASGGQGVREFILHARLELVYCDLLDSRRTSHSAAEIAATHGFNNVAHITGKFRQYFGATPGTLRSAFALIHPRQMRA